MVLEAKKKYRFYFEEFSLKKFGKTKKYYEYLHTKKIITS